MSDFESGLASVVRFHPGEHITAGQSTLSGRLDFARQHANCAQSCAHHLAELAEKVETEWVWREGYGWVERPVEVEEQPAEETAA